MKRIAWGVLTVLLLTGARPLLGHDRRNDVERGMTDITLAGQPSPEHARLHAMAGTWDVEMTFWFKPGAPPIVTKGTSAIRPILNGMFIEETTDASLTGTLVTTKSWTGYNADRKVYEATRIASTNSIRIAETGTFDEKTKQFEFKAEYSLLGDTWRQRTVIQQTSADMMTATSYLGFGTVPDWKAVEIKYTRSRR
jgi:hypothetical protein